MAKREAQARAVAPAGGELAPQRATAMRARNPARERLYADIGGAIIGVSAAAALINIVFLP